MVRCNEFYKEFEKKGNFCGKSEAVVLKIEAYIDYMRRNKFGDFRISSNAIEPFMRIENLNNGVVHKQSLKELRKKVKKIGASRITRRISIELINKANSMVLEKDKITSIPDVRIKMGSFEHSIEGVSHETREMFDEIRSSIGIWDNNKILRAMVEYCKDHIDVVKCEIMSIEQREMSMEIDEATEEMKVVSEP